MHELLYAGCRHCVLRYISANFPVVACKRVGLSSHLLTPSPYLTCLLAEGSGLFLHCLPWLPIALLNKQQHPGYFCNISTSHSNSMSVAMVQFKLELHWADSLHTPAA